MPFIRSFIVSEVGNETVYKVLPDTGVVIGFQYKGRLTKLDDGKEDRLSISGVSGITDRSRTFRNSPDTGTILVMFREAGAAPFFKHPIHEMFRESISLDNFILRSELLCLEEALAKATTDSQRITAVEDFLVRQMMPAAPDKIVTTALALIHQSKGNIRMKELTDKLNISQSPLEKRFRQVVGTTPKKFSSIVRLKHVIRKYNPGDPLTELGYEAGFYDQAHFIKEFKAFTGDTPSQFFSRND